MATNVIGGADGVTFPPGSTNQGGSWGAALESGGGGGSLGPSSASVNGYLGWSLIPEDAYQTITPVTLQGYLTKIVPGSSGSCGHLDMVLHATGTVTNAVFGLYTGPSFAVGPIAITGQVSASLTPAGQVSIPWTSAVQVTAGIPYWVYMEITTSAAPTFAGAAASGGTKADAILNVNLTASASSANNSMTLTSGAPTTLVVGTTTLTPQTSWINLGTKLWFGLKA